MDDRDEFEAWEIHRDGEVEDGATPSPVATLQSIVPWFTPAAEVPEEDELLLIAYRDTNGVALLIQEATFTIVDPAFDGGSFWTVQTGCREDDEIPASDVLGWTSWQHVGEAFEAATAPPAADPRDETIGALRDEVSRLSSVIDGASSFIHANASDSADEAYASTLAGSAFRATALLARLEARS